MSNPSLSDPNRWFSHFDRDGSGQLDKGEVITALKITFSGDRNSIRDTVDAVWPAFDRNNSGTIDRQEFCASGGMAESLLAAMQQQQRGPMVTPPQQQARPFVPSVYQPQASPSVYVQPSAPPGSPQAVQHASSSVATSDSEFWTCRRCTFVNKTSEPVCKACHFPQPNYRAQPTQMHQQPAPYVPVPPQQQQSVRPQQPPAPAPYVYQPPPATQPNYTPAPTLYQPQATTQPPATSQTSNSNMQTFRVLIPSGTEPGQQIRVETGSMNPPPSVVAVPARNQWGYTPQGQSYFDVQLSKEPQAPKPTVIQGSYVAPLNTNTPNTAAGSYTQPASAPSYSQTTTRPQAPSHSMTSSHQQAPPPSRVISPAIIWPQHVTSSAKTLVLKERSMSYSGDDAQIKDVNGNIVFMVQAELMTMSQRRYLIDTRGQKIGSLRHKKTPGLHPTVYIGTTSDEKKCSVKMSGMLDPFNCNASIYLGLNNKIGKISGNWRAKKFSITLNGSLAAKVLRKRTMSSMFMGADTYCIDVQPGVDVAFVSLIAIALDELYNDDKGGRTGGGIGGSFGPGW